MKTAIVIFISLFFLISCQTSTLSQRIQPLKQDTFIHVYLNHNKVTEYTDPYRQIKRAGDNLEQVIIDKINSARSTIDIAVQEFRLPLIAQALAKKHEQGIQVRIILENTYNRSLGDLALFNLDKLTSRERDRYSELIAFIDINRDGKISPQEIEQRDAITILRDAKLPTLDDTADGSVGSALMHHKFTIIDRSTVLVGSANYTMSDIHGDVTRPQTRGNANNLLEITNPQLADIFTEEFNLMWGDGVGGKLDSKFGINKPEREPKKINFGETILTVHFSPSSPTIPWTLTSNGLIGNTLKQANNSIDLALYVFSEQKLANILESLHQKNIQTKALIDPEFAFRNYSEGLDMLGVALSEKCQYEKDNRPWQMPVDTIGIPQLPKGDKLHHKFGLVDKKTVITGSHNWSAAANNRNDETLLVINNPTVTAHFVREFEQLYEQATLGLSASTQKKIQTENTKCPSVKSTSLITNDEVINLNTASQAQLETLPGIGPKLATRIIEARQRSPFTSLDDLNKIEGISDKKLQLLKDKVTW
jgi:phosphatidylserine/phosphatidylglycerophosphate/cardiolipin synthase-like enzyme